MPRISSTVSARVGVGMDYNDANGRINGLYATNNAT